MREILFRAKSKFDKNNKWVYGDLLQGENSYISTKEEFYSAAVSLGGHLSTCVELVDKKTIGQYTGLCDKNGTKIFEGDIVKGITEDTKQENYGVIKYGKYKDENFEDSCLGFYLEFKGEQFSIFNGEAEGYDLPSLVEVVDNIHDNPELLEE